MTRRVYFPILGPLRLMASLLVVLTHSTIFFRAKPLYQWASSCFISHAGYYGVMFFYVLSGFLITYLLLAEKEDTGSIDDRQFYRRRILRIWPLYYLIIILSFFILPLIWPWRQALQDVGRNGLQLLLCALFLPNVAAHAGLLPPTCFQTYTIGYEEQFYLFWPWVMRISRRFLFPVLMVLFAGHYLLEIFHLYLVRQTPGQHGGITGAVKACLTFINLSNLPAFVAGGIAACVYLYGSRRLLEGLKSRVWTYLLVAGVLVMLLFIDVRATGFVNIVSLVYAWLILNLILRNAKIGRLQGVLAKGGEISYGIYIYHPAIFILVSALLKKANLPDPAMAYFLYLIISIVVIMAVSALSYRYLERPFLRRKYTSQKAGGQ